MYVCGWIMNYLYKKNIRLSGDRAKVIVTAKNVFFFRIAAKPRSYQSITSANIIILRREDVRIAVQSVIETLLNECGKLTGDQ